MSLPHRRTDRNVFVGGITRGGKTVTGNELHDEFDGTSVFWNSEEESNVIGYLARDPIHIIKAIKNVGPGVKVDYRPAGSTKEQLQAEFAQVKSVMFDIAEQLNRQHNLQIVADEAQDLAEQGHSETDLVEAVRKGLKRGLKVTTLSQEPAQVHQTIKRQSDYHLWCGGYNPYYENYFKSYNIPTDELKGNSQGDVVVFEGSSPIGNYRAKSKYA